MASNLADRLASAFPGWHAEAVIFAGLLVVLLVGGLAVLWYGYASKYVFENRPVRFRRGR